MDEAVAPGMTRASGSPERYRLLDAVEQAEINHQAVAVDQESKMVRA